MILNLKKSISLDGGKEPYNKLLIEFNKGSSSFNFLAKGSQLLTAAIKEHTRELTELAASKMNAEGVQAMQKAAAEEVKKPKKKKIQIKEFIDAYECEDIVENIEEEDTQDLKVYYALLRSFDKYFSKFNEMVESELQYQSHSTIKLLGAQEDFGQEALDKLSIRDRIQIGKVFFIYFLCI